MKYIVAVLINILFFMPAFADHRAAQKNCQLKYEKLKSRHSNINRLNNTIVFHEKAYQQYKSQQNFELANFHKQHHNYLLPILRQQKLYLNKENNEYNNECKNYLTHSELHFNNN